MWPDVMNFYARYLVIMGKIPCVLHQNAMCFAPKRSAISTKTQCILHQNAVFFDANGLAASLNCKFIRRYAGLL